jgi:hypothetical protein
MPVTANALPTKRFFIDNLTRDLSLEDALLDLVDNSIDAFVRTRGIDVSPKLLTEPTSQPSRNGDQDLVRMEISSDEIVIRDRCGGITRDHAINHVFRMGRVEGEEHGALGVYGIGLKRAVFKMGRDITIESRTKAEGFRVHIDVTEWAADDTNWQFPITFIDGTVESEAGTIIRVRELNPEVLLRIDDGTLFDRLTDSISATYTLFLERFLTVSLNGTAVPAKPLPIGRSEQLGTSTKQLAYGEVFVEIFAGLAARIEDEWTTDRAGWYVLCNGRVVVNADKTDLTGWGLIAPQYASKYRGFIGIAFFFSENPAVLPWTTTKRGLNRESTVFQLARKEMSLTARPVLTFLNNMYPSEPVEEVHERKLVEQLRPVTITALATQPTPMFEIRQPQKRERPTTVSVQYRAQKADIERIKNKLNEPNWGAGAVGKYVLDYFLRVECPE